MRKIWKYECLRLMRNKFFPGLLAVHLLYGWQVLNRETIFGTAHTAPFSPWSFSAYLSRMSPLIWFSLLLISGFFFASPPARRVQNLTNAAPMPPLRYGLAQCAAVLTAGGVLSLSCLTAAAVFYQLCFRWHEWKLLLFPALLILLPLLSASLGIAWFTIRRSPKLLFLPAVLPVLWNLLPLPEALGALNGTFFLQYPLTLKGPDPAFSVPPSVLLVQAGFMGAGIFLMLAGCRRNGRGS